MPELNIDGLVGPTHNYAGLSYGNLASQNNQGHAANPKAAALQGLRKMRWLVNMGIPQAVMPPHERPFLPQLRRLGFQGSDKDILQTAVNSNPILFANHCSASSMWTANAATVSPSTDCEDKKLHFTPANLSAMLHRSIEHTTTTRMLKLIFRDETHFQVHDALPAQPVYGDEGAANHNRLSSNHTKAGLELFIYGRRGSAARSAKTQFPSRQTSEACQAIIRRHKLRTENVIIAKQNQRAIDAGAFHNDVVCVTNGNVMLYHQDAFDDLTALQDEIKRKSDPLGFLPIFLQANKDEMPLTDAISSYVFNSQIITLLNGEMALILPKEAEQNAASYRFIQKCLADNNPITQTHYLDLKQSMSNGGGPACLRLRVQMTSQELSAIHQPVIMTHKKIDRLEEWVKAHYRDRLETADLADPDLLNETRSALDELTQILEMGSFYHFQEEDNSHWNDDE